MHKNRTDALLHRYIKEIRKNLPCPTEEEKRALDNLKESVSAYLLEYPEATAEDIAQRFGTPAQITETFLETEGTLRHYPKIPLFKKIVLCVLVVAALAIVALGAFYVTDMYGFFHGHYNDTVAYGTLPPPESGVREF